MDFEQHQPTHKQKRLYREIKKQINQSGCSFVEVIEVLINVTFDLETIDGKSLTPKDLAIMIKREA